MAGWHGVVPGGGEAFLVCWLQGGTGGFHASLPRFRNAEKPIRAHIVVVVVSSFFFLIIGGMGGRRTFFFLCKCVFVANQNLVGYVLCD